MADKEQLRLIKSSVAGWNAWVEQASNELNPGSKNEWTEVRTVPIDLREADLAGANLSGALLDGADLMGANLENANLQGAFLPKSQLVGANLMGADASNAIIGLSHLNVANLRIANLSRADLRGSDLHFAMLNGADLRNADLSETTFSKADLSDTDLRGADLSLSILVGTKLGNAQLAGCRVYGCSAWDIQGIPASQNDLIISKTGMITTDDLEVAQFIYLMYENQKIRNVIDSMTAKGVLILGRFSPPERKAVLDGLREKLREFNLLPIVFDFDRPTDKDFTETIKTLAGLSYFVIADVTNPKSSPLELQATVPDYQIPFVPIIQEGEDPFAMMVDLQKKYDWVLKTVTYDSMETLMKVLKPLIIDPAMKKRQELRLIKAREPEIVSAKDYLAKGGL
jgi:hypothetical protein